MQPKISIIVAIDSKRGIGKKGGQPFYIKEDLKRFKALTTGHPVIMGRKTFEAVLGHLKKPFPNRTNIVITRDNSYQYSGANIFHSLDEAINYAKQIDNDEIFIIGGGQIFNQAIDITDRLYLTKIDNDFVCDVFFPDYSEFTKIIDQEEKIIDGLDVKWLILEKHGILGKPE